MVCTLEVNDAISPRFCLPTFSIILANLLLPCHIFIETIVDSNFLSHYPFNIATITEKNLVENEGKMREAKLIKLDKVVMK